MDDARLDRLIDSIALRPSGPRQMFRRLLCLLFVAAFASYQYQAWLESRRMRFWRPPHLVLGPLYFLATPDPGDDWIGIALLCVFVPCIAGCVIWPTGRMRLLACAAVFLWILMGVVTSLPD